MSLDDKESCCSSLVTDCSLLICMLILLTVVFAKATLTSPMSLTPISPYRENWRPQTLETYKNLVKFRMKRFICNHVLPV